MPVTAPLRVPGEIRRPGGARWFRLASGVSEAGLLLLRALPEQADGPLSIAFHLPEDAQRLELTARAVAIATGEDAPPEERLALRFLAPDEEVRARVARYVLARVPE